MAGVTIKDIAQRANVSHTTVSRALNDNPCINEETRRMIKELAASMNYVPNKSAKSLVDVRSYNIGIFFTSLVKATSSDFIYSIIQNVNESVPPQYTVIYNGIDKLSETYRITRSNYDGVLFVSQNDSDDKWISQIHGAGVPLVVINRKLNHPEIKNIFCEEKDGVEEAVEFLIRNGHRDIAYIKGNEDSASTIRRYSGFAEGMQKYHLEIQEQYIMCGDYSAESGYQCIQRLLRLPKPPSAVICASDAVAFGAARAIREYGLQIPNDISLAGFDDGMLASYSYPQLTSISRPIDKMAMEGIEQLIRLINGEKWSDNIVSYPVKLSVKGSVKCLCEEEHREPEESVSKK